MLKSIRLKNIKGHKDSVFNLSPGLNVICGDTDSGKSTVSRAFNWLITNQRGYSPRPWKKLKPKGESSITVETVEGDAIERVKHTGINGYKLNGEVFKALGSDVPEEVKNALRMEDINLQPQKNAYYLLNETGGTVAKEFNRIANLENMDNAISKIQSRKVEKKQEIEQCKVIAEKKTRQLKDLEFITTCNIELTHLEDRESDMDLRSERLEKIKSLKGRSINAQILAKDIAPVGLFSGLEKLKGREVDWAKLDKVHELLLTINGVQLVPKDLFLKFEDIYTDDILWNPYRKKLRLVKKQISDHRKVQVIDQDLFDAFDEMRSRDFSKDKIKKIRKTYSLISDLENDVDGFKVEEVNVLGELSLLKSQVKTCSECGRVL